MKDRLLPLAAGLLFAVGLAVSGMTEPAKVVGFLDVFGAWDPSLAFVMLGAVAIYAATYHGIAKKRFSIPTRTDLDRSLIVGAAIFGVGWGLSGFCPGPALVSLGAGTRAALWFVPAALAGMALQQGLRPARLHPRPGSDG